VLGSVGNTPPLSSAEGAWTSMAVSAGYLYLLWEREDSSALWRVPKAGGPFEPFEGPAVRIQQIGVHGGCLYLNQYSDSSWDHVALWSVAVE